MKQTKLYTKNEGGNDRKTKGVDRHARYKWERHSKKSKIEFEEEISHTPIKKRYKDCIDYGAKNYTPLYKYLIKQVCKDWDEVWKDVFPRVDGNVSAIQNMIVNVDAHGNVIEVENKRPTFKYSRRYYGNRYFSSLFVDDSNILQFVDKNYRPPIHYSSDTQSFNGKTRKEKFDYERLINFYKTHD